MTGRQTRKVAAVVGMMGFVLLTVGSRSQAQVAYVPGVGFIPSGQTLTVTPVVSADRRYVRIGVDAFFNALNGFTNISFPSAAVGGGNFGGVGGGFAGMNGVIGQGALGAAGMGLSESGDVVAGAGFGESAMGTNAGSLAPDRGESLAGAYFAPPEGLIKGDPFSLDAIEKNRDKPTPPFPLAQGDQEAAAGFPGAEDAFAEDDWEQMARPRARTVRGNRANNSKVRSTPQQSRTPNRTKAKKTPKNKSQSTGVDSK
jgi:hypothetical protein